MLDAGAGMLYHVEMIAFTDPANWMAAAVPQVALSFHPLASCTSSKSIGIQHGLQLWKPI